MEPDFSEDAQPQNQGSRANHTSRGFNPCTAQTTELLAELKGQNYRNLTGCSQRRVLLDVDDTTKAKKDLRHHKPICPVPTETASTPSEQPMTDRLLPAPMNRLLVISL